MKIVLLPLFLWELVAFRSHINRFGFLTKANDSFLRYSNGNPNESFGESQHVIDTKYSLMELISESWQRVVKILPDNVLQVSQDEIKGITTMLVLATVRRAADYNTVRGDNRKILNTILS